MLGFTTARTIGNCNRISFALMNTIFTVAFLESSGLNFLYVYLRIYFISIR